MSRSGQSILRGACQALDDAKSANDKAQVYDALLQPDALSWLALDEDERIKLVEDYHRRQRMPLPRSRRRAHALFHILIENQTAAGSEPAVKPTVARLITEGLDRHDAVHAVANVMAEMVNAVVRDGTEFSTEQYQDALHQLTAQSWLDTDWEC